jgi:hypothetical protein
MATCMVPVGQENHRAGRNSAHIGTELRRFDPARAQQLTRALETLGRTRDKAPLVQFGDAVLALVGGRRFEEQSGSGGW